MIFAACKGAVHRCSVPGCHPVVGTALFRETLFQCLQHTYPAKDLKQSRFLSRHLPLFRGSSHCEKNQTKPNPFPPSFTLCQLFPGDFIPFFWSNGLHCMLSPSLEAAGSAWHRVHASGLLPEAPKAPQRQRHLGRFVVVEAG